MMKNYCFCREMRTACSGIITNGNHNIKVKMPVFIDAVGSMPGDINAIFFHSSNRFWVYTVRFNSRTVNFRFILREVPQITFCNLASAAVSGAENKYFFLHI